MRDEREKRIQRDIELAIGALPGLVLYANGTDAREKRVGERTWREHNGLGEGTPDLVVGHWGRLVGLEVKSPDGRPEASQLRVQKQWHACRIFYGFVRSPAEALAALERAARGELE